MAMKGIIYGVKAVNSTGPRLELHWFVTAQSVKNNTSTIKIVSIIRMGGWVSYNLTTNGNTIAQGITKSYTYTPTSATSLTRTVGTTYHTVKHNSDGSLTLSLSGSHTLRNFTWSGVSVRTLSASQSITIDKITRGVDLSTIKLASGFSTIEGTKTITFTKLSSTATVKVYMRYYNGNTKKWSSNVLISSPYNSGNSVSIASTTQQAMYSSTPPDYKTIYTIWRIEVYQSNTLIQSEEKGVRFTLKVLPPTINITVKCTGQSQHTLKSSTRAVQGVHFVEAKTTATARNGATIKKYSYNFQGNTYSGSSIKKLVTKTGTLPVKVTVVDSRGGTSSKTVNITSLAYEKPKLVNLVSSRYKDNSENPLGKTWKVTGNIKHTSVTDPSGKNINYPFWKIDEAASYTINSTIIQNGTLPIERTKTMILTFGDNFSPTFKIPITIPRGEVPFAIGQKGIGVGVMPPNTGEGLYVKDDLFNGLKATLTYPYFFADFKTYGASKYIEAIKLNWNKIKEGVSLANCHVATKGVAIIFKYPSTDGDYGVVLTFGYGAGMKIHKRTNGKWEEVK